MLTFFYWTEKKKLNVLCSSLVFPEVITPTINQNIILKGYIHASIACDLAARNSHNLILWKDLSFLPTDLSIAQSLQALKFPLKFGP